MATFALLHLLAGLIGVGAGVGLLGPWRDWTWQFSAAMWAAAIAVVGSGIVLSLSTVGTDAQLASGMVLGKVVLTVPLLGLMYSSLLGVDSENPPESRSKLLGILALWLVVFALGIGTVL